jgi:cobyrinic acid a,c-diamide synthase
MREAVRCYAEAGRPVLAECGGLLYLGEALEDADGRTHAMAGVLPFRGVMQKRRVALGYAEAEVLESSLFGPPGTHLRGHEFHYSEIALGAETARASFAAAYRLTARRSGSARHEGFCRGDLLASYVHVHFADRPEIIDHLLERCLRHRVPPAAARPS